MLSTADLFSAISRMRQRTIRHDFADSVLMGQGRFAILATAPTNTSFVRHKKHAFCIPIIQDEVRLP